MATVTIPEAYVAGNVTFYSIKISLPLRSISVSRRYSEFYALTDTLCRELGINQKDFPYPLPPKGSIFHTKASLIAERKIRLAAYLNGIIRDRELQNSPSVHRFLELPVNFRFTAEHFKTATEKEYNNKTIFNYDDTSVDDVQWLSYFRQMRSAVSALPKTSDLASQLEAHESVNQYIGPNLGKLASSLQILAASGAIDLSEVSKRTALLLRLEAEVEEKLSRGSSESQNRTTLRRVFAMSESPPQESNRTMTLNNQQLLQQQQHVHQKQDQELEQLRKIIGRQRQIGEAIHREVEEQNEMLDEFTAEVEASSDKLQSARSRARQIG